MSKRGVPTSTRPSSASSSTTPPHATSKSKSASTSKAIPTNHQRHQYPKSFIQSHHEEHDDDDDDDEQVEEHTDDVIKAAEHDTQQEQDDDVQDEEQEEDDEQDQQHDHDDDDEQEQQQQHNHDDEQEEEQQEQEHDQDQVQDENDDGEQQQDDTHDDDDDESKQQLESDDLVDYPMHKRVVKPMSTKALAAFKADHERRGVIYLSRIPPFMKPQLLRSLLSKYGEILRIFLTPEDAAAARRRKKSGGNRAKKFVDGWVEFGDKRDAKRVAIMLNNQPIGGKKRSYYHDDLWNIKYLSKFKWTHLTEKIAYERHVREQKIRMEMQQAKHESEEYKKNVEHAQKLQKKRKNTDGDNNQPIKVQRTFHQRQLFDGKQRMPKSQSRHEDV